MKNMLEMNDEDGCGGEKERKTEAEVDGQCDCGHEGVGTVGGGEGKEERSGGGWTV